MAGKLSADDVLYGLIDHGLFNERLPSCFTSEGLTDEIKNIDKFSNLLSKTEDSKFCDVLCGSKTKFKSTDYIHYNLNSHSDEFRAIGIPYPSTYVVQAISIHHYWNNIVEHTNIPAFKTSRIFVQKIRNSKKIFEMNYKERNFKFTNKDNEIKWQLGNSFVVKTDISKCFPSIYTHSIPWAVMGRFEAKNKRKKNESFSNVLDYTTRLIKSDETNGLIIGPVSSNIISEIILTRIDYEMQEAHSSYGKFHNYSRHIDDYRFFAPTEEVGNQFLRKLSYVLNKYSLTLNIKKTRIDYNPHYTDDEWAIALRNYRFDGSKKEVSFDEVDNFLNLAYKFVKANGSVAPINYAAKIIEKLKLNSRAKRMYIQRMLNFTIAYPYLCSILNTNVIEPFKYAGYELAVHAFYSTLFKKGYDSFNADTLVHSLWYAIKYGKMIEFTQDMKRFTLSDCEISKLIFINLMNYGDCILNVMVHEYSRKFELNKVSKYVEKLSKKLYDENQIDEQQRQWLFIYQTWNCEKLKNHSHSLLAELKKRGFEFVNF